MVLRHVRQFWTSRQRQASSIHEVSYRACFKPQLPRFFINILTRKGDIVYDPFSGSEAKAGKTLGDWVIDIFGQGKAKDMWKAGGAATNDGHSRPVSEPNASSAAPSGK